MHSTYAFGKVKQSKRVISSFFPLSNAFNALHHSKHNTSWTSLYFSSELKVQKDKVSDSDCGSTAKWLVSAK